jgi:hypothetical protein
LGEVRLIGSIVLAHERLSIVGVGVCLTATFSGILAYGQ